MIDSWSTIEAGWQAVYGTSISDDLIRDRRPWRWFRVRLVGLLARDTPTATLWDNPTGMRGASPEAVGDVLEQWSQQK